MKKTVLFGMGGHAKSVIDSIESAGDLEIVGFIAPLEQEGYRGLKWLGDDSAAKELIKEGVDHAVICIGYMGDGEVREQLYSELKSLGYTLPAIVDPTAAIADDAFIGEGSFVGKNAVVNSAATVGRMCIINSAAVVEHDCHIGDFSHISVNATLCGNVNIGEGCFIGAGSTVIQGVSIGDHSLMGAGSIVLSDAGAKSRAWGIVK